MASTETSGPWGEGVRISAPKLVALEFAFTGEALPEEPLNVEFGLSLHRFGALELGVEFSVEIKEVPDLTARVAFRMIFSLVEGSPEASNPELALRLVAARMAPVAMYPFMREALASVSQKALLEPLLLPVRNIGAMWDPEGIVLPAPADTPAGAEEISPAPDPV